MKNKLQRLTHWISTHRTQTMIVGGLLIVAISSGITYAILSQPAPEQPKVSKPKPVVKPVVKHYSPLTGVEVKDESLTTKPVTAVMIENSPDARPQSGLKEAGIVFEANAEGGITRFVALYQEAEPELIGPVRSLRPYYLDWAAPFQASIAHVGGSAEALRDVGSGKYRDIDQFFNPNTYWRASDRYAPHNVYTNANRLAALNKDKGYTSSEFTGFSRQDGKAVKEPDATSITINLSSDLFNTSYTYDNASNSYLRSLAGQPHNDREKGQINPSVVIALRVDQGGSYYQEIGTHGNGEAIVFQNGTATKVTWKKADRDSQLQFIDANDKPFALNRGQTWITATPTSSKGSVTWQ